MGTAGSTDHMIYRFIRDRGGRATKQQIFEALGDDAGARKAIEERLRLMATYGIVKIEGDEVRVT